MKRQVIEVLKSNINSSALTVSDLHILVNETNTGSGSSGTDIYVTGGTYSSGTAVFTNNTGGVFNVTGFTTGGGSSGSPITIENTSSLFSTGLAGTGSGSTSVYSNFLGEGAGSNASGDYVNFLGNDAGAYATDATFSNFFGYRAGYLATNAHNSTFIGYQAGYGATNAQYSNFMGFNSGYETGALYSNFLGYQAGTHATSASRSNFLGGYAGNLADSATNSNFFGYTAGNQAYNANNSNFFGAEAGYRATNASYSNLFGYHVGNGTILGSIGSNNIIIGTNISLPSNTTNSINFGGVLFGTGTYSTTGGDPSIIPTSGGRIGIGVVTPSTKLHVYSETVNTSGLRLERLTSSATTSAGQAIGVDASGNVVTVDPRPYKLYTALLTQTGTDAPTAIVLENTIGDIVWTRQFTGVYLGTLSNAFTNNKTWVIVGHGGGGQANRRMNSLTFLDTNQTRIFSDNGAGTTVDGLYLNTPIEIRVYN